MSKPLSGQLESVNMDRMNDRSPIRHEPKKEQSVTAESGGAGVPPAVFLPIGGALKIRSRRLPHWEIEGAVYFVTFRLADSLPRRARNEIISRRKDILATAAQMDRKPTAIERRKLGQLSSRRIERILDRGAGNCFLRNPMIAQAVADALNEFDGSRYRLFAWCVMPNHVHVLFQTSGKASLANILHSWKSYSAKVANRILARRGEFWLHEYYDHLVRNVDEFERAVRYIAENPGKAGLENWPWVWLWM